MREIVLDTETTGLNPDEGHRIVEIGGVELINHVPTGRTYHQYINPGRPMPQEAFEVHGLGDDFLAGQPAFRDIAQAFLDFIADAPLVIHNAAFDMRFINAELGWMSRAGLPPEQAVDTLVIARRKFPGAPASLDALCRRLGIDNSAREIHGAVLDSRILAEVYLQLIGGRQPYFALAPAGMAAANGVSAETEEASRPGPRPRALPPRITEAEAEAHAAMIAALGEECLWNRAG